MGKRMAVVKHPSDCQSRTHLSITWWRFLGNSSSGDRHGRLL